MNATLLIMLVTTAITTSVAWHGRGHVLARRGHSPITASGRVSTKLIGSGDRFTNCLSVGHIDLLSLPRH